jgi:hypothetical protein
MKTKVNINIGILGFIFIALKLFGIVSWPWIWVLAPFWIGIVLLLAIWGFVAIVAFLALIAFNTGNVTITKRTKP